MLEKAVLDYIPRRGALAYRLCKFETAKRQALREQPR